MIVRSREIIALSLGGMLLLLAGFALSKTDPKTTEYPSFQELVDATAPNGTLIPPAGTYAGPVVLEHPITIDGRGEVTIDAGGKGSVIYLDTDGATIKNLHLTNSGESHNDIDSGVQVKGSFNVIKDNLVRHRPGPVGAQYRASQPDLLQRRRSGHAG